MVIAGALGSLDALVGIEAAEVSEALVVGFLERVLTSQARGVVDAVRGLFTSQRGGIVASASLLALWTVSTAFTAAIDALNIAYGLTETRSWLHGRVVALGIAIGSIVMLAVALPMLVLGPLFGHGAIVAARFGAGWLFSFAWDWLRAPAGFLLLVVWAATLYWIAPCHRVRWRSGLPGAALAALLAVLVSLSLGVYLDLTAAGNPIIGVLGGGLILLIWVYFMSAALLLGGELNARLASSASVPG